MAGVTLRRRIIRWALAREPNVVIGERYLKRWYFIPRNRFFNIYIHQFVGSDYARALHDHPWVSLSWCLQGKMLEVRGPGHPFSTSSRWVETGNWVFRRAKHAHRLVLYGSECWTLFITGPVIRKWGFLCADGWRPWDGGASGQHHGAHTCD